MGEAIIVGGAPTVITDGWWGWCGAAPHMSRRMSPAEFLPLPWDGERDGAADARDVEPAEEAAADFDSRMDAAIRRWGLR